MRRSFSILLIAIFSLGPLSALSSASEDASLPACCRRNGKHHCAMAAEMAAAVSISRVGAPVWNSAPHCPYFPRNATVRNTPVHALTASSPGVALLLARARRIRANRAEPLLNPVNPLAGRGPPA